MKGRADFRNETQNYSVPIDKSKSTWSVLKDSEKKSVSSNQNPDKIIPHINPPSRQALHSNVGSRDAELTKRQ